MDDEDLSWFHPEALRPAKRQRVEDNFMPSHTDRRPFILSPLQGKQIVHKSASFVMEEPTTSTTEGMISSTTYSAHSPPPIFSPKVERKSSISSDASSNALMDEEDVIGDKEIDHLRYLSQRRLKSAWDSIFERYGRDMEDEADEIDLSTEQIIVDRGHLKGVRKQCRIGSLAKMGLEGDFFDAIEAAEEETEDTDADADISSSDEQVYSRTIPTPPKRPAMTKSRPQFKPLGQGAATKALQQAWTKYEMDLGDDDVFGDIEFSRVKVPTLEEFFGHGGEGDEDEEEEDDDEDDEGELVDDQGSTLYDQDDPNEAVVEQEDVDDQGDIVDASTGHDLIDIDEVSIQQEKLHDKLNADRTISRPSTSISTPINKRRCACGKVFCFGCVARSM